MTTTNTTATTPPATGTTASTTSTTSTTSTATPFVAAFFDEPTNTVSYVVADRDTNKTAVIDSVLGYDAASGRTNYQSADKIIDFVKQNKLDVEWLMETHAHADHLSAAPYLQEKLGGKLAIGKEIIAVQEVFGKVFNEGTEFQRDGSQFDVLLEEGTPFKLGTIDAQVLHTPGHTPACMSYVFGDAAFVGDTLFMPDFGTARCDFPGGDAHQLYRSIHDKLFTLPDETRVFLCHDYKAPGREEFKWESTIGEQKRTNVHVKQGISEKEFVEMRTTRDAQLAMPKLILPSIQVNMRGGDMPEPEEDGVSYLKIPVNKL